MSEELRIKAREALAKATPVWCGAMVAAFGIRARRAVTSEDTREALRDRSIAEEIATAMPHILALIDHLEADGSYVLPCDVHLPPATVVSAGCDMATLKLAMEYEGRPRKFVGNARSALPVLGVGERCTEIADRIIPNYRGKKLSCSGPMAKRWQAAWDGAYAALGGALE